MDLWVADVQDVFPSIMEVAKCFRTTVVTTSDSGRLPGAEHYGLDHEHSNIGEIHQIAEKIVQRGIESFVERRDIPVKIPQYEVDAEMGFSVEWAQHYFEKGLATLAQDVYKRQDERNELNRSFRVFLLVFTKKWNVLRFVCKYYRNIC